MSNGDLGFRDRNEYGLIELPFPYADGESANAIQTGPRRQDRQMQAERPDTGPSFYERAIRTTIGRGLRSYYDLAEPIPEQMTKLLRQIDDNALPPTNNGAAGARAPHKDKEPKSD